MDQRDMSRFRFGRMMCASYESVQQWKRELNEIKIWLMVTTDKCTRITNENDDDYYNFISPYFKGTRTEWKPIKFTTGRKGNKSDCAEFELGYPVFMRKAKEILAPYMEQDVEFLPIMHDEHELFMVKVNRVQDFVDMSNPVQRRINYGFFSDYVHIHPEKIDENVHIFRKPQRSTSFIYVSDVLKQAVEANKLKGFHFVEIWDTDNTEDAEKERLKRYDIYYEGLSSRERVSFHDAWRMVSHEGKIVRNNNKMIRNSEGVILIGEIFADETVSWIDPTYIAPLYFDLQWIVYEGSESDRSMQEYFAELSFEANGPGGNPVAIPDKALEAIIRRELQLYKDELTDTNLLKLIQLSPGHGDASPASLRGLEFAKNLMTLSVGSHPQFDLKELTHIPESVQSLAMRNCGLSDITIMGDLTLPIISRLYLEDNSIDNLCAFMKFSATLKHINVGSNQIKSILPLNELRQLDYICISNNPVTNISELELPKLRYLYIDGIQTEDWSFLSKNFPALEYVSISDEGMTEGAAKSLKEVIKRKLFTVYWSKSESGDGQLYNRKFIK